VWSEALLMRLGYVLGRSLCVCVLGGGKQFGFDGVLDLLFRPLFGGNIQDSVVMSTPTALSSCFIHGASIIVISKGHVSNLISTKGIP
jgi:hypothetical protein